MKKINRFFNYNFSHFKFYIMKLLNFNVLLILVLACSTFFYSCEKEDMNNTLKEEIVQDYDQSEVNARGPLILVDDIVPLLCCGFSSSYRRVRINLQSLTASFYTSPGTLHYKFYKTNNPCAAPITFTSGSATPSFCLLPGEYTLFICDSLSGCALSCAGGVLSIPSGVPSSSPLYTFTVNPCKIALDK